MARKPVIRSMRSFRGNRRGLAEIVGTLMLVVIVVAAATAFSFFVASYQKQVQNEETLTHNKNLENVRILALVPTEGASSTLTSLLVEVASLDVNPIDVYDVTLDGNAVTYYNVTNSAGVLLGSGCLNGNPFPPSSTSCSLDLPAEAQVYLQLDLNPLDVSRTGVYSFPFSASPESLNESSLMNFKIYTSLGNEFVQSFVPPVALAGVTFVSSYPILDGSDSYQPSTGTTENVSIDMWQWSVSSADTINTVPNSGIHTGSNAETAYFNFTVPPGYVPSSAIVAGLKFASGPGYATTTTALGGPFPVIPIVSGTNAEVSFTYTYTASTKGSLDLIGATLFDNATISPVTLGPVADDGSYSGQEVELPNPLTPNVAYNISLSVTSTESLVGSTQIVYELS